ncbi:MAG TPA: MMPL family transporter [Candidatus Saccharimonadales bacterium]|nr:MMPL family transporter [Candidatus Saccharimonadales bacterium]
MKSNKLRILLPIVLIILWLGVSSIGGPKFAKINNVTTNDQTSFLPKSADSTKVASDESAFLPSTNIPTVILITSPSKISVSQFASLIPLTNKITKINGVVKEANNVIGPIPSKDGKAAEFIVQLKNSATIDKTVKNIRATLHQSLPSNLTSYVTGPGGLIADLINAFSGIDGILLFVAVGVVFFILLIVYRSIILPFIVLMTSIFALTGAIFLVYELAFHGVIKLNGQSQGILSILVIGASTDYSLLLISRFKEYLHQFESKWQAMAKTLRFIIEPIGASAATVSLALLCLLFSNLNSNRALGPIAAIGIVFAFAAVMTLLPSILVLFGRKAFWPFQPRVDTNEEKKLTVWQKIAGFIEKRPRIIWTTCLVILLGLAFGLTQLRDSGVSETASILGKSDAVTGQTVLAQHFPAGSGSPAELIVPVSQTKTVLKVLNNTPGLTGSAVYSSSINSPIIRHNTVLINSTLVAAADSNQAENTIIGLRNELNKVSPETLVGGTTATLIDTNNTDRGDLHKIIPIVLVVILIILMLLLRAILAPVILIGSVILSFASSLGLSALVFNHLFHFPGSDAAVPLFGFIFLVALGVDYNIFLMTRVREESIKLGTHRGIFKGLSVTGSVITSAGVVLAATFAALSVIPILFLVQIAFIVAAGVLIDTIIVRSLLVPGLVEDIGKLIWWPSKLWKNGKA